MMLQKYQKIVKDIEALQLKEKLEQKNQILYQTIQKYEEQKAKNDALQRMLDEEIPNLQEKKEEEDYFLKKIKNISLNNTKLKEEHNALKKEVENLKLQVNILESNIAEETSTFKDKDEKVKKNMQKNYHHLKKTNQILKSHMVEYTFNKSTIINDSMNHEVFGQVQDYKNSPVSPLMHSILAQVEENISLQNKRLLLENEEKENELEVLKKKKEIEIIKISTMQMRKTKKQRDLDRLKLILEQSMEITRAYKVVIRENHREYNNYYKKFKNN